MIPGPCSKAGSSSLKTVQNRHKCWLLGVNTRQDAVHTKMAKGSERALAEQKSICYKRGLLQFWMGRPH